MPKSNRGDVAVCIQNWCSVHLEDSLCNPTADFFHALFVYGGALLMILLMKLSNSDFCSVTCLSASKVERFFLPSEVSLPSVKSTNDLCAFCLFLFSDGANVLAIHAGKYEYLQCISRWPLGTIYNEENLNSEVHLLMSLSFQSHLTALWQTSCVG